MKTKTKVLITILLAIAFWLVVSFLAPRESDPREGVNAPTLGQLRMAYRDANEKYFYGGLPERQTDIVFQDMSQWGYMGHFEVSYSGRHRIALDPKLHPTEKQAEMTLLHEMCHQYNRRSQLSEGLDGHGSNFQFCMLRLAEGRAFNDLW